MRKQHRLMLLAEHLSIEARIRSLCVQATQQVFLQHPGGFLREFFQIRQRGHLHEHIQRLPTGAQLQ